MIEPKRHIGHILARRRESLGLTQAELGKRMGKSQSYITRVEGGKRDPRWETILEFARALELEPLLIPRDRLAAVDAAMNLSASDDVPPLTGGQW
jgi:transcriptional regulator with XRE-family HTH domain